MKGIEAATAGVVYNEIELKTSKAGNAYLNLSLAVNMGNDEDGKPITQWVKAAVFGETAEKIARTTRKGDKVYIEGQLSQQSWTSSDGEQKTGLNIAAFKAEKIGASAIGKNRERLQVEPEQRPSRIENYGHNPHKTRQAIGSAFKAKDIELDLHKRQKSRIPGLNDDEFEFNDRLPF